MKQVNVTERTSLNQPRWLTLLRVLLGLVLFWKGITFIYEYADLQGILHRMAIDVVDKNASWMAFLITYINLLGGLFITVGLFTRTSCMVQIPILLGAVFFVNNRHGLNQPLYELIVSAVVLVLLILFAIKGSGVLSADEYFRSYYKAGSEDGNMKRFYKSKPNNWF